MANSAFVSWISEPACKSLDSAMQALSKGWQRYQEQGHIDEKVAKHLEKASVGLEKASAAMDYSGLDLCGQILDELRDILKSIQTGSFPKLSFEAISFALVRLPTYVRLVASGVPDIPAALFDVINVVRLVRGKSPHIDRGWLQAIPFNEIQARKGSQDIEDHSAAFEAFLKEEVLPSLDVLLESDDLYLILDEADSQLQKIQNCKISKRQGIFTWLVQAMISNAKLNPRRMDLLTVVCLAEACQIFFKVIREEDKAFADTYIPDSFLYLLTLMIGYAQSRSESAETLLERLDVANVFHVKADVENVRHQLGGANLSSVEDVYPLVLDQLNDAERELNLSSTNGRFKKDRLLAACGDINRIASTLEVVGDQALSSELKARSADLINGQHAKASYEELSGYFNELADGVLFVRRSLDVKVHGAKATIFSDLPMDPSVIQAFLKEARGDLRLIRQKLGLHLETGEAHSKLLGSVRNLGVLSQSLSVIDLGDTANALRHLAIYLYESISNNKAVDGEKLKSMAMALTAIELRLEYLSRGLIPPSHYIDQAKTSLVELLGDDFSHNLPPLPDAFLPSDEEEKATAEDLVPLVKGIVSAGAKWDGTRNETWQGLVNLFSELTSAASFLEYRMVTRLASDVSEIARLVEEAGSWNDDLAELTFEYVNEVAKVLDVATSDDPHLPDNCLSDLLVMKEFLEGNLGSVVDADKPLDIDDLEIEAETNEEPETEIEEEPDAPGIDDELLTIFEKEYAKLSATLAEALEDFLEVPEAAVPTEKLIHCCHTLKGVSHTIERPEMARVFGLWEDLCNERQADNVALSANEIDLYKKTVEGANQCVAGLRKGARFPDAESLTDKLKAAYESDDDIEVPDAADEMEQALPLDEALTEASEAEPPTLHVDVASNEISEPSDAEEAAQDGTENILNRDSIDVGPKPAISIDGFQPHDGQYDSEMLDLYLEEAASELYKLDDFIADLDASPTDEELHVNIKRLMHTLKGSANMAGATTIGFITHELEELLSGLEVGSIDADTLFVKLLSAALDILRQLTQKAEQQEQLPTPWHLLAAIQYGNENDELTSELVDNALKEGLTFGQSDAPSPIQNDGASGANAALTPSSNVDSANDNPADVDVSPDPIATGSEGGMPKEAAVAAKPKPVEAKSEPKQQKKEPPAKVKRVAPAVLDIKEGESFGQTLHRLRELRADQRSAGNAGGATPPKVKVDTQLLDQLIDSAFEVNVDRDRVVLYQEKMERSESALRKLTDHIESMQATLQSELTQIDAYHHDHPEFLAPEYLDHFSALKVFARDLEETTASVRLLQETIKEHTSTARYTTRKLTKTTRSLRENLFNTRLVPVKNMLSQLRTVTNKTGDMVGKKLVFEMEGESTQIDRNLLDTLTNNRALEHLIRNSGDHGIEAPEERKAKGKPEEGKITLKAQHDGDRIFLKLRDDGGGIDPVKVKAKAVEKGIISEDSNLSEHEVLQLITSSGFSTAASVTQVSGRGVGMDVVRSTIENLGGSLSIRSELGKGTEFILDLPYTQGVSRALVVGVGEARFAIPTTAIDSFGYVAKERLTGEEVEFEGGSYRWMGLNEICGLEQDDSAFAPGQRVGVIVVKDAARPFAIACDIIHGMQALHLKPVPFFKDSLKGVLGLAETIDGILLTVIDPRDLCGIMVQASDRGYVTKPSLKRQPPAKSKPLAIVADDSVALRKSATRFLERIGYQVITATNGREALLLMDSCYPSILVTDLEMPQMDGFELTRNVRKHPVVSELPIVMVTSRSTDDIEKEAFDSGVNCFLPKPFNAEMLADAVGKAASMEVRTA